jgi:hypothetical protein
MRIDIEVKSSGNQATHHVRCVRPFGCFVAIIVNAAFKHVVGDLDYLRRSGVAIIIRRAE